MRITGLIIFGDSILAGTGASQRELSCAKLIKSVLPVPVSLRGRNWNTSQDGLDRLEDDVLSQKQLSHVLILFGNNDSWLVAPHQHKISIDQFRKNMSVIVQKIQANGQKPVLCNLQLLNGERFMKTVPDTAKYLKGMNSTIRQLHQLYNEEIKNIAKEMRADFVDISIALEKSKEDVVALDGIHPNDLGHKLIAKTVVTLLKQLDTSFASISDEQPNKILS